MTIKTCGHPPCSCQVTDGEYCSEGCRTQSHGSAEDLGRCRCEHPSCQPKP